MADIQFGKANQLGVLGTVVFTTDGGASETGTILRNGRSRSVRAQGNFNEIGNNIGETTGLIINNRTIEQDFTYFPEGASLANSLASSNVPGPGWTAAISGAPIERIGSFTDGINTNDANTQPWFVVSGSINETSDGQPASINVTMRRFPNITSATAIS